MMAPPEREWIGAGVPPGLQSRLGSVNSGAGGFDSHALPPPPSPSGAQRLSSSLTDFEIREYRPGDEHRILDLFNRTFASVDPGFVPRTLASWRWQFLANPSGWRIQLCFTKDGALVSQYAGIRQRALLDGAPASFCQGVDSMTDRAYTRGLKKPGLFVLTGYPWARAYGGPPPDKETVCWGWPVPAAWRIGRAYLGYQMVRPQPKLSAPPHEVRARRRAGIELEEPERFPADVEALFRRAAAPHRAIAVRDRAQLDWRFCEHPERRYRLALARRAGELQGLAVYGQGAFDGEEDQGLVCDWLVAPGEEAAGETLRAWLAERALAGGAARLVAAFPDSCTEWLAFQRAGLLVTPSRYFVVSRTFLRHVSMSWLRRHWYYTLGDTDLV